MRKACLFFVGLMFVLSSANLLHAQGNAYEKGLHAYLGRDYKTAVKYLKEYVAVKPDAKVYFLLGYARYESIRRSGHRGGKKDIRGYSEAIKYFGEAYRIDPDLRTKDVFNKLRTPD
jgi:tetratricopeptide (TPR) repeat protein